MNLRDLVDSTLSDIRIAANQQRRERVSVTPFLTEIANAGRLHAEARGLQFAVEPGDLKWAVTADPQLLASAVSNLLNNAFKYTAPGGRVVLRATANDGAHLLIDVEDECGGIPESEGDPFQSFAKRRGRDRTGLGLGLSIARKAVRAQWRRHPHSQPARERVRLHYRSAARRRARPAACAQRRVGSSSVISVRLPNGDGPHGFDGRRHGRPPDRGAPFPDGPRGRSSGATRHRAGSHKGARPALHPTTVSG
jgi:signal transduction histidine kinase